MLTPYYTDEHVTVHHGDCLDVLRGLPDCFVDAVVTDPPYDLTAGKKGGRGVASVNLDSPYGRSRIGTGNGAGGFMGKAWDATGVAFDPATWRECLRVLKPGGHMLAFGGSRTWHRLACAVEDAGFEIRDSIAWLYGSGFSKGGLLGNKAGLEWCECEALPGPHEPLDDGARRGRVGCPRCGGLDPAFRGFSTTLKPAFEPVVVARKPLAGTVAQNVLTHGTGALNIDATRINASDQSHDTAPHVQREATRAGEASADRRYTERGGTNFAPLPDVRPASPAGRWPANVVLDESQAAALDEQSGTLTSGILSSHHKRAPKDAGILGAYGSAEGERGFGDSGGASRFFPVFRYESKANSAERPFYYRPTCECEDSWPTTPTRSAARVTDATTEPASSSTSKSGSATTGNQSPTGTKSTTLTGTSSTTTRATSWQSPRPTTSASTRDVNSGAASGGSPAGSAASSSRSERPTGTSAPKAGPSTEGAARATSPAWSAISVCGGCGAPTRREAHATVKPLDLMRWLVRLVTPPGGVVLDPFAGSGTTAEACVIEGFRCVLIEREAGYLPLIVSRLTKPLEPVLDFTGGAA